VNIAEQEITGLPHTAETSCIYSRICPNPLLCVQTNIVKKLQKSQVYYCRIQGEIATM